MTLQRRLAFTLLVSSVPLVAGLAWVRITSARHAEDAAVRDLVLSRATGLGRQACEASPESFAVPFGPVFPRSPIPGGPNVVVGPPPAPGIAPHEESPGADAAHRKVVIVERHGGPGPGLPRILRSFTYDQGFKSVVPNAPAFPAALREAMESGRETASRRHGVSDERGGLERLEVAVRTGWTPGPCAYVLVLRDAPPPLAPIHEWLVSIVPLLLGLVAVMWLASEPVVRRVRALSTAVRDSAATRYETPVPEAGHDEITDLARAFNEAGAEVRAHVATVERRDRTLREFLANTTHDVMIPLTVLQGHLAAIEREASTGSAVTRQTVVGAMSEAHHIGSLLHNLSAVAKLEAPEDLVHRHAVDLAALVERVVERHRPLARPAGVSIEYAVPEEPVTVTGDVTLLEQAVGNVVHNAVRYNRPGGQVAVVLEHARGASGCRLRVVDDGPGVEAADLERLTERRYRDDAARHREPSGMGLGLAIAREVADRHGVAMRLRRVEPTGLEVVFEWETGSRREA
jgi:signal transduction histidine kinase